jgi:hypothetical protein
METIKNFLIATIIVALLLWAGSDGQNSPVGLIERLDFDVDAAAYDTMQRLNNLNNLIK